MSDSKQPRLSHEPCLDGWRGLAIAAVIEGHFVGLLPGRTGRLGVDAFFALSGYLMAGLLFIGRQPLKTFYKRRISRILPVFLVFTLTVYGLALLLGWSFTNAEFWATLLFLRTYVPMTPDIVRSAVPITHLWSLNVEEHAYVAMSALRLVELFKRRMDLVLLGIGTVAVLISLLYQMAGDAAPHWKEKGSEEACAPLMLAAGYRLWRARRPQSARPWLATVATVMALLPYFEATASLPSLAKLVLYYGAPFWFAVAVNHLSESVGPLRRIVSFRPLQFVGLWSYSIYLWQQPFYVHRHAIPGGPASALALALLVSLASYYYLERPTRDWLNARW
jgi:peptidoglycan/LPS O-acetylase OafA/YrhL